MTRDYKTYFLATEVTAGTSGGKLRRIPALTIIVPRIKKKLVKSA